MEKQYSKGGYNFENEQELHEFNEELKKSIKKLKQFLSANGFLSLKTDFETVKEFVKNNTLESTSIVVKKIEAALDGTDMLENSDYQNIFKSVLFLESLFHEVPIEFLLTGKLAEISNKNIQRIYEGGLDIQQWQDLEHMLHVMKSEKTEKLRKKIRFEKGRIHIDDKLVIIRNKDLITIPVGLHVHGECSFEGCKNLSEIPKNTIIEGNFDLMQTGVKDIARNLIVKGDLGLEGCVNLKDFSKYIQVGGAIDFSDCKNLVSLPEEMTVMGSLFISNCDNLVSLPKKLIVEDWLHITYCNNLLHMPEELEVRGDEFYLSAKILKEWNSKLTLHCKKFLIEYSPSLKTLPQNITLYNVGIEVGDDIPDEIEQEIFTWTEYGAEISG